MRSQSLGFRLILVFVSVSLPLLLGLIGISSYAKQTVLSQVASSYQNLVNSNIQILDKTLEDTGNNMYYLTTRNENFLKLGTPNVSGADSYFARMNILEITRVSQSYFHNVDLFFIYSLPNDLFLTTDIQGASSLYKDSIMNTIPQLMRDGDFSRSYLYAWKTINIDGQTYLLRLSGDEMENNVYLGALIHVDSLKQPLQNMNLGKSGEIVFVSQDGRVLSGQRSQAPLITGELPKELLAAGQSFPVTFSHNRLLVVNQTSQKADIHLAVVLPEGELLQGLQYFKTIVNVLPALVLAVFVLCLLLIRRLLLHPIQQLLNVIRRIKQGDMRARLPETKSVDFSIIHQSFNSMVEEITDLKIGVYEERLRAQKAELRRLQSQINPHFFMNTMNVIFQLADMKRGDLVKKTVQHLVKYFRFSMTTHEDLMPLSEELAHIRNYLEIQKMRFQDSFEFEIELPEEWTLVQIPPLIVQPFVENAMIHGYSVKPDEPFRLRIGVEAAEGGDGYLQIRVSDNGKGFSDELLATLPSHAYAPVDEDRHIGIWNVKQRLAMRYETKRADLVFRNGEPGGAIVDIYLPLYEAEER